MHRRYRYLWHRLLLLACMLSVPRALLTQQEAGTVRDAAVYTVPRAADSAPPASELRPLIERFTLDENSLTHRYRIEGSRARREVLSGFYLGWQQRLAAEPFERFSQEGRVDYLLLRQALQHRLDLLELETARQEAITPLLPFLPAIRGLAESRERLDSVAPDEVARMVARIAAQADSLRLIFSAGDTTKARPLPILAARAAQLLEASRQTLADWRNHYAGYDPRVSWWVDAPWRRADSALADYSRVLREKILGAVPGADAPIIGDPLGREALVRDIAFEMIDYTPEELLAIGERELAWCEKEMKKAAREMGLGDDWKAALEKVKQDYAAPGDQPRLVKRLADEAADFVERENMVTVPPLARDDWRLIMLTAEEQKVNPFFLGGDDIMVAFPTDAMPDADKRMTLRGNNIHFARATVHHELIPGHHLQGFLNQRYQPHRQLFSTPFWTEGWAVYMEMMLYDRGFPRSPEDRIGMLFWRMHRAARIIFSLKFHLGQMTPPEAIDFLVEHVGHERANATAEVRRSFNGSYPPLYQAGYMLGALQLRALRAEVVGKGKMTERQFHDAVLKENQMPIELVRALLLKQPLTRNSVATWRFAESR